MKRLLAILLCGLGLLGGQFVFAPSSYAFLKMDISKAANKAVTWFKTMAAKCQTVIDSVQSSQFGQFVGKGIEYTKKGIKFAQDTYNRGMELYGQVVDSAEYKATMISKDIAVAGKELKGIQEEKLKKQKDIQAELDLLKEQTEAKIKSAQTNLGIAAQEYENTKSGDAEFEPTSELQALEDEINQIQEDYQQKEAELRAKFDEIEELYKNQIETKTEQIANLTKSLAATASNTDLFKNENVISDEDSAKALKENESKMFTTEPPSVKTENKIFERRQQARSDAVEQALVIRGDYLLRRQAAVDKIEGKEGLADTMSGESEGSGVSAEVLVEQLNLLQDYINIVLSDLTLQTSIELGSMRNVQAAPSSTKFNLCNYADPKDVGAKGLKSSLSDAKNKVTAESGNIINKAQEAKDKVTDGVNNLKTKGEQAVAKVGELKNQVEDGIQTVKDVADEAQNISTSLEGML